MIVFVSLQLSLSFFLEFFPVMILCVTVALQKTQRPLETVFLGLLNNARLLKYNMERDREAN
jgi:hypothetical protein